MAVNNLDLPDGAAKAVGYLEERGFPNKPTLRDQCHIEITIASDAKKMMGYNKPDPDGRMAIVFHYPTDPVHGEYCTTRFLGKYVTQFGTEPKGKQSKLMCPKGPVRAYVPEILDWAEFTGTLYLCESVLKSLVMASHGYYAVGGNGVACLNTQDGWVTGFPTDLLKSGEVKKVVVLFDNDVGRNPNVTEAVRNIVDSIQEDFNVPCVHWTLPDPPPDSRYAKGKGLWGIDDYAGHFGVDALHEYLKDSGYEVKVELSPRLKHMDALNAQYVFCQHPVCIVKKDTGNTYKTTAFYDLEAPRLLAPRTKHGAPVSASKEWVKYEDRTMVPKLLYRPTNPTLLEDGYNTWRDGGPESKEDSVSIWLDFVANAIPDKELHDLLQNFMAYKMRHRDVTLNKTIFFIGEKTGTGKSLFAKTMGEIVGRNNRTVMGIEDFGKGFNKSFSNKEIILIDDIGKMADGLRDKLKRYTTSETMLCEPKGVDAYEVENYATFFMTSNNFDAVPIDEKDRRILAIEFDPIVHHPVDELEYWDPLMEWLWDGGYAKLRWYYEEGHVIPESFTPNFMPPMTDLKKDLMLAGMDPIEGMLREFRADPSMYIGETAQHRVVITVRELGFVFFGAECTDYQRQQIGLINNTNRILHRATESLKVKIEGRAETILALKVQTQMPNSVARGNIVKYPVVEIRSNG